MPLDFTRPDPRLLRELEAVAAHAGELRQALKANVAFPGDFPFDEIELLTGVLIGLPAGTAEGSKEILDYGRVRLADIGQRFIKHGDDGESGADGDLPPGLERGMAFDRAIGALLTSISYAQAEYARQSGEAIEDDSGAEAGVHPDARLAGDLPDLRGELQTVEGETGELGRRIEEISTPGSERAEDLGRQVRDAGGHVGIARNELEQSKPRPGRLERMRRVLATLPDVIEKTGQAMEVCIDVAEPFADQWFNKLPTDIFNLVVDHLRQAAENVGKAGRRLKEGRRPSRHSNGRSAFTIFRDIDEPWCPEMVMLPAGAFIMGSPEYESGRWKEEGPQHQVTISQSFALGRFPVTFDEYDHFCAETGRRKPSDRRWGRGRRPVIYVDHDDAIAYCTWLSKATGSLYRLPSEACWEYGCRSGTTTAYEFGDRLTNEQANFARLLGKTSEVDAYPPNAWGLHDMHGNVWEWCLDWFHGNYEGASADGSAQLNPSGGLRVLRGGSWYDTAQDLRSACRRTAAPRTQDYGFGFRCIRIQEV